MKNDPKPPLKQKKQLDQFAKYSSLGIQMGGIIALGAWGGVQLDRTWNTDPLWTIVLSLLGVFSALWLVYRSVTKNNDPNK